MLQESQSNEKIQRKRKLPEKSGEQRKCGGKMVYERKVAEILEKKVDDPKRVATEVKTCLGSLNCILLSKTID